jgi:hypothetical protein
MNWLTRLVGLPATRPTTACFVPPILGPNKGPVPQSTIAFNVAKIRMKKLVLGDKGAPHPPALVNLVKAVNPLLAALFYFLGPSTLLSTIFRASAKTSAGVENGSVAASLSTSSSCIVTINPAWRVRSRRWKLKISDLRIAVCAPKPP